VHQGYEWPSHSNQWVTPASKAVPTSPAGRPSLPLRIAGGPFCAHRPLRSRSNASRKRRYHLGQNRPARLDDAGCSVGRSLQARSRRRHPADQLMGQWISSRACMNHAAIANSEKHVADLASTSRRRTWSVSVPRMAATWERDKRRSRRACLSLFRAHCRTSSNQRHMRSSPVLVDGPLGEPSMRR
jgi:hypothetical protein